MAPLVGQPSERLEINRARPSRLALAVLLACALLAAGCTAASSTSAPSTTTTSTTAPPQPSTTAPPVSTAPSTSSLVWRPCGQFRCSSLTVPVSYARPGEGTLGIAVIELPATSDPATARDLVLNPGGPGASGVQFLQSSATTFPASLRAEFNLVSFDPRGIGESDPVVCAGPAGIRKFVALDPEPSTAAEEADVIAAVKSFDAACAASVPRDVLANLSTEDSAYDMNRLREALGQAKLDYLGFSYGTYLGALYAAAFPSHVGNMVLDGAFDAALGTAALDGQQANAFQVDLDDFFAWCPTNTSCRSQLPGGAETTYRTIMSRLEGGAELTADLPAVLGGTEQVDFGVALTGVIFTLYSTTYWPYLAQALAQAASGNGQLLAELAYNYAGFNENGTVSNLISANIAISCLDRPAPPVSAYPALARRLAATAPDFGPGEAWGSIDCDYWPVPATGKAVPLRLSRPLPLLVVGSTHDPATPYAWAQALTSQLRGSELVTRTGDGHTGYFSSTCVQALVDTYLDSGERPPAGTVCASTNGT